MNNRITDRRCGWLSTAIGLFVLSLAMPWSIIAYADGQEVMDIKIRAQNRSIDDTPPHCGVGPGMVGDRLDVDVSVYSDGNVVGTARFEDANGVVELIDINDVHAYRVSGHGPGHGGGLGLFAGVWPNPSHVIAIWLDDFSAPMHVTVEKPHGCANTISTFTVGQDKVTVQIKTN